MAVEQKSRSLVQGTLHMLILKTLALEPMHGYGIGVRLEQISNGGKYYALTAQGRATLKRETKDWEQQTAAISRILSASLGDL